jgi:hypothetical protein
LFDHWLIPTNRDFASATGWKVGTLWVGGLELPDHALQQR